MFIMVNVGSSIMTIILILIGVLQDCAFIVWGIIWFVLIKKLRDN